MIDFSSIAEKQDMEIADLLKKSDPAAWEYIFAKAALPVIKRPHISRIMADRHLSRQDVYGMLFEEMIARKKIDLFGKDKEKSNLLGWMKWYVWGLVHKYCKKNPWAVSDEATLVSLSNESAPESKSEIIEMVDVCFRDLWQENQLRAYVHFLKLKHNLSAKEIKELLGLSSEDNVNQLFSRAVKDMKRLKRKYEDE